uniref:Nucleolar protein 6 n=1 Tax=Lutzomyia longipalpis TaxID=7200 RepID=A0A1B0CTL3_LUTLO
MSSSEEHSSVFSDSDGDVDPELTQASPKYAPKHKLQGSGDEEKRKRTKWDLKKAPTAEEINVLKESSNLYHSNLFRMQVEEMLKEIAKVQTKHRNYIENWLIDFNKFLMALPAGKEKRSLDDLGWLKKIKLPLDTSFLEETKGTFQFVVPKKSVCVVGSQKLGTILGNHLLVDICIEMPKEFFQTGDYLNMIYHRKRALYLCYILKHLKKKSPELGTQQEFMYARGNPLKPILLLTNPEKNKHVTFAIHLACEEITYKLVRFIPLRNNVRSGVIRGTPTSDVESEQCATPHYNSSILEDFVMLRNEKFILECFEGKQNVRDAAILLKVWLKQRGLDRGYSGFSGYLITILLAHLLHARKLNSNASSYQIIRILWTYLGESAWNEVGKGAKCMQKSEGDNKPSLEDFHKYFRVVFVDSSGFLNLCATLSEDLYKRIRLEAKIALNLLDNSSVNSFHCLFMASIPLCLQYDHFLSIPHNKDIAEAIQKQSSVADTLNYCTFWYPRLQDEISDILRKGLSSRIIAFCPLPCEVKRWDVQQIPGCSAEDSPLTFGFIVHPQEALDVVIKGPQANEPEAVEFRNFWGEKSQLRRFKDGSITEACIWAPSSSSLTRKRMISRDIVFHLLSHHLEMSEESLRESCTYSGNELNCEITAKEKAKGGKYRDGYDTEMMSLHVIQEFDALGKVLRSLEDLPLEITAVQGTSPIFRYCDPIANFPNGYSAQEDGAILFYGKQIYEGVLQLSLSGKWPDSVVAIEKLKQAFYLELMKKLSKNGIKFTRVSMNGIEILKGGFIFRFQVAHAKELALRKQIIVNGIAKQRDSPESVQFERELFILPRLSSALNG